MNDHGLLDVVVSSQSVKNVQWRFIMTIVITNTHIIIVAVVIIIVALMFINIVRDRNDYKKIVADLRKELNAVREDYKNYKRDSSQEFRNYKTGAEKVLSQYRALVSNHEQTQKRVEELQQLLNVSSDTIIEKEKELNDYKLQMQNELKDCKSQMQNAFNIYKRKTDREIDELSKIAKPRLALLEVAGSNLSAIPYMAGIVADYETIGIERIASALDWGHNVQRAQKVASIREIREYAKQIVEQNKYAQYQLAYLLELYPGLQDVIDSDYNELPMVELESLSKRDPVRDYLSKEEYNSLSTTEKNQRALDKYVASHAKTKWQIGRDFELFVGHEFLERGWSVEFYGENMGLEDLGRDLIVKTLNGETYIVQCKYWSQDKIIHEKHITQLYGTTVSYCIEHGLTLDDVKGTLITNIKLSDMAKKMATYLDIEYLENHEIGDFPRIKCNNGVDEYGIHTKIYHLPFDQQYDTIKMKHKDDFWAYTVEEAERAGYRRAYKWFGKN